MMGSVPLIAARRVGSIDELVAAAAGGARVRVAGLDEPVAVRLVRLVQLWVEAADHNVEVVLAGDAIEFRDSSGSDLDPCAASSKVQAPDPAICATARWTGRSR